MTFNKKEFAQTCGTTVNEMFESFNKQCSETYMDGDYECKKYGCRDFCSQYVYVSDYENGSLMAIPYGKDLCLDKMAAKPCMMKYVVKDIPPPDEDEEPKLTDLIFSKTEVDEKVKTFSEKLSEANVAKETEIKNLKEAHEAEVKTFQENITNLTAEKTELLEFKENILNQEKEQKIQFALDAVKDVLTETQIKEWQDKAKDYDNIDSFKNAVLAYAFTLSKKVNNNETPRIHIPIDTTENNNTSKGLWD